MKKTRLIMLLSFLMLSAMCITIGAEGNEAKIGETEYATFGDARGHVKDGETIELLSDVTVSVMDAGASEYTIDGGGKYALTMAGDWWGAKKIAFTNITVYAAGRTIGNSVRMTLGKGAVLTVPKDAAPRHILQLDGTAQIIMEEGSKIKDATLTAMAIEPCANSEFIMNGGKISGITGTNAIVTWSTSKVTLNGGEISGNTFSNPVININSGTSATFGENIIINDNGAAKIVTASGADSLTVADKFAETVGYRADGGATYWDRTKVAASVDSVPYTSLSEAIGAASAGKTVLVENDTEYSGDAWNNKAITIDGQKHSVTIADGSALWGDSSDITFKNVSLFVNNMTLGNGGKITLGEGAILSTVTGTIRAISVQDTTTFTMNEGSFIKDAVCSNAPIELIGSATAVINGGTIEGVTAQYAVISWSGSASIEVNGGTVSKNSLSDTAFSALGKITVTNCPVINNNGTMNAVKASSAENMTLSDEFMETVFVSEDGKVAYDKTSVSALIGKTPYKTFTAAVSAATAGQTVTLFKDSDYSGDAWNNKAITVDGQKHSITFADDSALWGNSSNIVFNNVTLYVNGIKVGDAGRITLGEGAILTMKPSVSSVPAGIVVQANATLTLNGGEISGIVSNTIAGGVQLWNNAKLIMNGGKITNNSGWEGSGINCGNATVSVTLSGGAYVFGNKTLSGQNENIAVKDASIAFESFTGKAGLNLRRTNDVPAAIEVGTELGTVTGTVADTDSIVSDTDNSVFARAEGGKLIWTAKPSLAIAADIGKYTKAGDETVYGVLRIITTSETDASVPVERFGTAYVKTWSGEAAIVSEAKYIFNENNSFENGSGYIVDIVDIDTGKTYTYIPVSFYKIAGIEKTVYVTGTPVTFDVDAESVKDLGEDPEDLKY